jgi:hypothetical protein
VRRRTKARKQRATTNKEDASAPTVSIEAVNLSATIDALEGRDVATVDIPGVFMQANIDEVVHVKFEGEMAKMQVKLVPSCTGNMSRTRMVNQCCYRLSY